MRVPPAWHCATLRQYRESSAGLALRKNNVHEENSVWQNHKEKADLEIGDSSVSMVLVIFADFQLPMGNAAMGSVGQNHNEKKADLKIGDSSVSMVMVIFAEF